jgi:hypothetical protein
MRRLASQNPAMYGDVLVKDLQTIMEPEQEYHGGVLMRRHKLGGNPKNTAMPTQRLMFTQAVSLKLAVLKCFIRFN